MAIILSNRDLAPLYRDAAAMDGLLGAVEASLCCHAQGTVAGQVRLATSLADAKKRFRVTSAAVPDAGLAMRVNGLFSGARDSRFILLFDGENGSLLSVMADHELNVWRTGAPAGVASRYLARSGADTLGILGSGRQARGQLLAIQRSLRSLRKAKVFSPTVEHRSAFAAEMSKWLGIEVQAVDNPKAAIANSPVISLATNSRSTVIESSWIAPGALVNSITSGQLPKDLVANSRVIVSWKEEVLAGEAPRQPYAAMIAAGEWSGDKIDGELGEIILGKRPGRRNESEITVFESVGMPIWDSCAAAWAYRWALAHNAGMAFSLD